MWGFDSDLILEDMGRNIVSQWSGIQVPLAYFSDPILQGIMHQLPDVCPTSDSEITIVADPRIPFPDQKSPEKSHGAGGISRISSSQAIASFSADMDIKNHQK